MKKKKRKGHTAWNKGKKLHYTVWNKGKKGLQVSWKKGKKFPPQSKKTRIKRSITLKNSPNVKRGKNHWAYKNGKSDTERKKAMKGLEYRIWREAVFARDNWTCQKCDVQGGKLEADHIKPWALYPELRYAIDNGRTLCIDCHRKTETWGSKFYFNHLEERIIN